MKKYFNFATFYLILSLAMGVFYREFTRMNNFTGKTTLSVIHTHLLVLGFIFFILVLLLEKNFNLSENKNFKKWYIFYNFSLIYLSITFAIRGTLQVLGKDFIGLNHIAGLSHVLISIALIWFVIITRKSIKE